MLIDWNKGKNKWSKFTIKDHWEMQLVNQLFTRNITFETYAKLLFLGSIFHETKEYLFLDNQDKLLDLVPLNYDEHTSRNFSAIKNHKNSFVVGK